MKQYFNIALTIAYIISASSAAYSMDWGAKKVQIQSFEQKEGETILSAVDENGYSFTLKYTGELTDAHADIVLKLNRDFRKFDIIKTSRVNFVITNEVIEGIVIPSSLNYKSQNYLPNVPSGLIFSYGDYLEYNFRVSKNNYFVRINDRFTTEEAMCKNIAEAVKNPKEYLKKREPEYLFNRIEKLDEENKALKIELSKLSENNTTLVEKHEKLLYAVMTIHNTGFLGFGKDQINKKSIERVLELKKGSPELTKKQISETLEKDKIELSSQELELILNVYFNEFD